MTGPHPGGQLLADVGIAPDESRVVGPVLAFPARARDLVPQWRRLRNAHDRSGLWPFLIGPDPDRLADTVEMSADVDTAAEVTRALALDVDAGLAELRAGAPGREPPRGPAGAARPQGEENFHLARRPGWIGLVAADAGYLVPGLLNWDGAVNHDLDPALHVALLKQWHDRFGAELVGLSLDVLELRVPRPPTDPAEALAVAEQQYWYCPDIVDQGVGTLDALAAAQVRGESWYFWWD